MSGGGVSPAWPILWLVLQGRTMLCLPQAFDLFLKHLVGGMHTVYCKLKRLEITQIVCNVEMIRTLRFLISCS